VAGRFRATCVLTVIPRRCRLVPDVLDFQGEADARSTSWERADPTRALIERRSWNEWAVLLPDGPVWNFPGDAHRVRYHPPTRTILLVKNGVVVTVLSFDQMGRRRRNAVRRAVNEPGAEPA
jgi:hypothetical protein